jgi:hypothetical protein
MKDIYTKRASTGEGAKQLGLSLAEKLPGYEIEMGHDRQGFYATAVNPKASQEKDSEDGRTRKLKKLDSGRGKVRSRKASGSGVRKRDAVHVPSESGS